MVPSGEQVANSESYGSVEESAKDVIKFDDIALKILEQSCLQKCYDKTTSTNHKYVTKIEKNIKSVENGLKLDCDTRLHLNNKFIPSATNCLPSLNFNNQTLKLRNKHVCNIETFDDETGRICEESDIVLIYKNVSLQTNDSDCGSLRSEGIPTKNYVKMSVDKQKQYTIKVLSCNSEVNCVDKKKKVHNLKTLHKPVQNNIETKKTDTDSQECEVAFDQRLSSGCNTVDASVDVLLESLHTKLKILVETEQTFHEISQVLTSPPCVSHTDSKGIQNKIKNTTTSKKVNTDDLLESEKTSVANCKSENLCIQSIPPIDIHGSLIVQKLMPIEINSSNNCTQNDTLLQHNNVVCEVVFQKNYEKSVKEGNGKKSSESIFTLNDGQTFELHNYKKKSCFCIPEKKQQTNQTTSRVPYIGEGNSGNKRIVDKSSPVLKQGFNSNDNLNEFITTKLSEINREFYKTYGNTKGFRDSGSVHTNKRENVLFVKYKFDEHLSTECKFDKESIENLNKRHFKYEELVSSMNISCPIQAINKNNSFLYDLNEVQMTVVNDLDADEKNTAIIANKKNERMSSEFEFFLTNATQCSGESLKKTYSGINISKSLTKTDFQKKKKKEQLIYHKQESFDIKQQNYNNSEINILKNLQTHTLNEQVKIAKDTSYKQIIAEIYFTKLSREIEHDFDLKSNSAMIKSTSGLLSPCNALPTVINAAQQYSASDILAENKKRVSKSFNDNKSTQCINFLKNSNEKGILTNNYNVSGTIDDNLKLNTQIDQQTQVSENFEINEIEIDVKTQTDLTNDKIKELLSSETEVIVTNPSKSTNHIQHPDAPITSYASELFHSPELPLQKCSQTEKEHQSNCLKLIEIDNFVDLDEDIIKNQTFVQQDKKRDKLKKKDIHIDKENIYNTEYFIIPDVIEYDFQKLEPRENCNNYEGRNIIVEPLIKHNAPGGDGEGCLPDLKLNSDSRYEDEVEEFGLPLFENYIYYDESVNASTSADEDVTSIGLSEGEIKCKCNVSTGELHSCKYTQTFGDKQCHQVNIDKSNSKVDDKHFAIHRQKVYYKNWISYYMTKDLTSPLNYNTFDYKQSKL